MIRIENHKIGMYGAGGELIGEMGALMNAFARRVFRRFPEELREIMMVALVHSALEAKLEGDEYTAVREPDEEQPEYEREMLRKLFEGCNGLGV